MVLQNGLSLTRGGGIYAYDFASDRSGELGDLGEDEIEVCDEEEVPVDED